MAEGLVTGGLLTRLGPWAWPSAERSLERLHAPTILLYFRTSYSVEYLQTVGSEICCLCDFSGVNLSSGKSVFDNTFTFFMMVG